MKEHPIIFSAPMILALLAGRKSMTRRIAHIDGMARFSGCDKPEPYKMAKGMPVYVKARYKKGDLLWVKETWWQGNSPGYGKHCVVFDVDRAIRWYPGTPFDNPDVERDFKKRPSIFMPRWASRITLEVAADERIERVQDITEEDAAAEGFQNRAEFLAFFHKLFPKLAGLNLFVRVIVFRRIKP